MLRKNPEECSGLFAAYQFTDEMNIKLKNSGKEDRMDKEKLAKVNEILKAHGVRELSPEDLVKSNADPELDMEDLGQVIGGAREYSDNKINGYTSREAGSILQTIIDYFGDDKESGIDLAGVVADTLFPEVGKDVWNESLSTGGGYNACDEIFARAIENGSGRRSSAFSPT